jgi:hypothetical protein
MPQGGTAHHFLSGLIWVKAACHGPRQSLLASVITIGIKQMTGLEQLYLGMVLCGFAAFAASLAVQAMRQQTK